MNIIIIHEAVGWQYSLIQKSLLDGEEWRFSSHVVEKEIIRVNCTNQICRVSIKIETSIWVNCGRGGNTCILGRNDGKLCGKGRKWGNNNRFDDVDIDSNRGHVARGDIRLNTVELFDWDWSTTEMADCVEIDDFIVGLSRLVIEILIWN